MRVENAKVEKYVKRLLDRSRPPSRGGNTGAWHLHVLVIGGVGYSFRTAGSRKWVFKSDAVSFEWKWDHSGNYRNIVDGTLTVKDGKGRPIVRQAASSKTWRTAQARMPVSRSEFNS